MGLSPEGVFSGFDFTLRKINFEKILENDYRNQFLFQSFCSFQKTFSKIHFYFSEFKFSFQKTFSGKHTLN